MFLKSKNQVVLITGCSSGFGMRIAARLASLGHRVYATMRNPDHKERLLIEADRRGAGGNIKVLPIDVTQTETIEQAVKNIVADEGVIDVVINNAGFGMAGFFEDLSDADYRDQFDVNFFGVLNVNRAVMRVMRPRKKGMIINISSMAAFSGTPCFSAYCSSKWALEGYSECLYMELKPMGIHVALVEPGSYRTTIFEKNARYAKRFFDLTSPYFARSQHLKNLVDRAIQNNRRDPEEVAIKIESIINSPFPSFRNIVGLRSRLRAWFTRIVPFQLYAWLIIRLLSVRKK